MTIDCEYNEFVTVDNGVITNGELSDQDIAASIHEAILEVEDAEDQLEDYEPMSQHDTRLCDQYIHTYSKHYYNKQTSHITALGLGVLDCTLTKASCPDIIFSTGAFNGGSGLATTWPMGVGQFFSTGSQSIEGNSNWCLTGFLHRTDRCTSSMQLHNSIWYGWVNLYICFTLLS